MERGTGKTKRVVNFALCGFGRAGKIHFHGIRLNHRCKLKYIVDCFDVPAVAKGVRDVLEEYYMEDGVTFVKGSEFEAVVLGDLSLDAVVIATPTETHERYVKESLKSKKAVFCEKPLASTVENINVCYDLAMHAGCPLYCAFQRRFDAGMGGIRDRVAAGEVGRVYQIKTTSRDHPRPSIAFLKTSGGVFHDTVVHDVDMICWILGEEPVGVFAQGTCMDPEIAAIGDLDTVAVVLKFSNGVLSTTDISRHANYGYDMRLEVFGEKGVLLCKNAHDDPNFLYDSKGCTGSPVQDSFPQRFKEAYQKELDHFVDIVLDPSKPCAVTRDDVLRCSRIADACERSQKEGRMVELEPLPKPMYDGSL